MAPEAFAISRDFGIKHPHAASTETLSLKLAALNQPPDVALAGPEYVSDVAHSVRAVVLALPLPAFPGSDSTGTSKRNSFPPRK